MVLKQIDLSLSFILLTGRLKGEIWLDKLVETVVVSFSDPGEEPGISTIVKTHPKGGFLRSQTLQLLHFYHDRRLFVTNFSRARIRLVVLF